MQAMFTQMKKSDYSLIGSFRFAASGIVYALLHERNLRIHFAMAAFIIYFAHYYSFSRGELAVLFLVVGLVIVCELINTAIETTVDLESPAWHALAKLAKDVAAGAVLMAGITSVLVAVVLFWQPEILIRIFQDILAAPLIWIFLSIITAVWVFMPWQPPKQYPKR